MTNSSGLDENTQNIKDIESKNDINNKDDRNVKILKFVDIGLLVLFVLFNFILLALFKTKLVWALMTIFVLLGISFSIVTITGRIKYRKSKFFLVMFIILLAAVGYLLTMLTFIYIACANCGNVL